jgi:hypothetical protein
MKNYTDTIRKLKLSLQKEAKEAKKGILVHNLSYIRDCEKSEISEISPTGTAGGLNPETPAAVELARREKSEISPDPVDAFAASIPPNDPKEGPAWVRWFQSLVRHERRPRRLRSGGSAHAFVWDETRLDDDGVQPVLVLDPRTGAGTWKSEFWNAIPTCIATRPLDQAEQVAYGGAAVLWTQAYGDSSNPNWREIAAAALEGLGIKPLEDSKPKPGCCAGCGKELDGFASSLLPSGERICSGTEWHDCLLRYGGRGAEVTGHAKAAAQPDYEIPY